MSSFTLLDCLALAFYLAAAAAFGSSAALTASAAPSSDQPSWLRLGSLGRPMLLLGILAQFAATGFWCVVTRVSPFAGQFGTLSTLAWFTALLYLVFDLRFHQRALGAVALLITCLVLFVALLHAGRPPSEMKALETGMVSLHVGAIIISIALFTLAFGCACLYLLQNRLLKAHRVAGPLRLLPPLATLDNLGYLAVACGLPLLTVGLTLGIAYAAKGVLPNMASMWLRDPKILASFAVWFLYAFYLLARLALGWRGLRLQYVLIAGLTVALALCALPSPTHHFTKNQEADGGGILVQRGKYDRRTDAGRQRKTEGAS